MDRLRPTGALLTTFHYSPNAAATRTCQRSTHAHSSHNNIRIWIGELWPLTETHQYKVSNNTSPRPCPSQSLLHSSPVRHTEHGQTMSAVSIRLSRKRSCLLLDIVWYCSSWISLIWRPPGPINFPVALGGICIKSIKSRFISDWFQIHFRFIIKIPGAMASSHCLHGRCSFCELCAISAWELRDQGNYSGSLLSLFIGHNNRVSAYAA